MLQQCCLNSVIFLCLWQMRIHLSLPRFIQCCSSIDFRFPCLLGSVSLCTTLEYVTVLSGSQSKIFSRLKHRCYVHFMSSVECNSDSRGASFHLLESVQELLLGCWIFYLSLNKTRSSEKLSTCWLWIDWCHLYVDFHMLYALMLWNMKVFFIVQIKSGAEICGIILLFLLYGIWE